ncbi:hypothetical protein [Pseudodesulfovibrio pelocollis]|uniref:hypothetical protein n=1 Tax=Pseudodesulfovibrio pelocollis TaxID=3051432 RepID=UPI00255ABC65|nr:hypothetical protein [Pseudodesulfovibrio sp. SB368]
MRKFILALTLCLLAGCASRADKYIASLDTDADRVRICTVMADTSTNPNALIKGTDEDRAMALDLCKAAAKQVPNSPIPWSRIGELLMFRGDTKGACKALMEAKRRGHPMAVDAYCPGE